VSLPFLRHPGTTVDRSSRGRAFPPPEGFRGMIVRQNLRTLKALPERAPN